MKGFYEQIVEIQGEHLELLLLIAAIAFQGFGFLFETAEGLDHDVIWQDAAATLVGDIVLHQFDDGVFFLIAHIDEDIDDEFVGIVVIEDRKGIGVSDEIGLFPKEARAKGVEGGDLKELGGTRNQPFDPLLHLVGGLVGEGDRHNGGGVGAPFLDEIGDAVGQNAGLSTTRPGDDAKVLRIGGNSLQLGWIK